MADPGDFAMDYDVSFAPMSALGWQVDTVLWRDASIDWDNYDAVYICTPWDYPQHADEFMRVLQKIDDSSAHLVNELSLVRWSVAKTYLRDLDERGAAIVPSIFIDHIDESQFQDWFEEFDTDTLVIKPIVGGNATDAYVLENPIADDLKTRLLTAFKNRPFLVQPFIANIQSDGEYSLFFFSGEYSHATIKIPKAGDFRVQEEHGAELRSIESSDELIKAGQEVLAVVEPQPVYVRIDFVRDDAGQYLLMELELIEPSLYLRMNDGAAVRFAAAFDQHIRTLS